jgi:hypothetical protein
MFVIKPDALPKMLRISATVWISSFIGLTNIAASSAYMLMRILANRVLIGDSSPSLEAISSKRCRGSMARMNNIGERGSPNGQCENA